MFEIDKLFINIHMNVVLRSTKNTNGDTEK